MIRKVFTNTTSNFGFAEIRIVYNLVIAFTLILSIQSTSGNATECRSRICPDGSINIYEKAKMEPIYREMNRPDSVLRFYPQNFGIPYAIFVFNFDAMSDTRKAFRVLELLEWYRSKLIFLHAPLRSDDPSLRDLIYWSMERRVRIERSNEENKEYFAPGLYGFLNKRETIDPSTLAQEVRSSDPTNLGETWSAKWADDIIELQSPEVRERAVSRFERAKNATENLGIQGQSGVIIAPHFRFFPFDSLDERSFEEMRNLLQGAWDWVSENTERSQPYWHAAAYNLIEPQFYEPDICFSNQVSAGQIIRAFREYKSLNRQIIDRLSSVGFSIKRRSEEFPSTNSVGRKIDFLVDATRDMIRKRFIYIIDTLGERRKVLESCSPHLAEALDCVEQKFKFKSLGGGETAYSRVDFEGCEKAGMSVPRPN